MPRVDLQHHLEDLRDAYAISLEEAILIEIVAGALDSGATHISLLPRASDVTFTVVDDGRGWTKKDVGRHLNVGRTARERGQGVGGGAGIKLALLVADEVITETRRGPALVAASCQLATRYRAPLKWIPPPGLTGGHGTAVRLRLSNPLSPLLDAGYLEEAIRTHFAALLDPAFYDLLRRHYPGGIAIDVNGTALGPMTTADRDRAVVPIRLGRKRLPSAVVTLQQHERPLPEDQQGVAISVCGKVIQRGWEWLGLAPASAWRVTGLVEAPELAACLAPGRKDFIRTGTRGATYLALRKAIKAAVTRQLGAWGDRQEAASRPATVPVERDLERVLAELADDFPLLRALAAHGAGGQKRLPLPGHGDERTALSANPGRFGLLVQFESRPGDPEPGRFVDRTLWINEAHPAFVRAASSRTTARHIALTAALTLAPLATDASRAGAFITQFIAHWPVLR